MQCRWQFLEKSYLQAIIKSNGCKIVSKLNKRYRLSQALVLRCYKQ
jgi:hypothetical protein